MKRARVDRMKLPLISVSDEMEIVARVPHVLTRARDQIVCRRGSWTRNLVPGRLRVGGKDAPVTLRAEDIGQRAELSTSVSRQDSLVPMRRPVPAE